MKAHLKVLHRTALNGTPIVSVESTFPGIELNRKKSVQVFFSGKKIRGRKISVEVEARINFNFLFHLF